jgi:hypothetical protein
MTNALQSRVDRRQGPSTRVHHSVRFLCAAGLIIAALVPASAALAKPLSAALTFKGTLKNSLTGPCNTTTYDSKCPTGSCRCEIYFVDPDTKSNKATGSLIGKAPTAEIDITYDGGSSFVGSGPGSCQPLFASAMLTGSKDTQQLDFTGAFCSPLGSSPKAPLSGGFGIESSTGGHHGFGTLSGTIDQNTGAMILKFKGVAD